jgi:hypothetical protein
MRYATLLKCVLTTVVLACVGETAAQPVNIEPNGTATIVVPKQIECEADGTLKVVTQEVAIERPNLAVTRRPTSVLVETTGMQSPGFVARVEQRVAETGEIDVLVPVKITMTAEGLYQVVTERVRVGAADFVIDGAQARVKWAKTIPVDYSGPWPEGAQAPIDWAACPASVWRNGTEGPWTVEMSRVGPVRGGEAILARPLDVRIVTKFPDGVEEPGAFCRNSRSESVWHLEGSYPSKIDFSLGHPVVAECDVHIGRNATPGHGAFAPGETRQIKIKVRTPVSYQQPTQSSNLRGPGFSLQSSIANPGPLSQLSQTAAAATISAVSSHISSILATSAGTATYDVSFVDTLPDGVNGESTVVLLSPIDYQQFVSTLITRDFIDNESIEEQLLHQALPLGSLPCFVEDAIVNVSSIRAPQSLAAQLFVPQSPAPHFQVDINQSMTWNFDYQRPTGDNERSFAHTLAHEVLHGLGFISRAVATAPLSPSVTCMDVFRMPPRPSGIYIASTFSATSRELTTLTPAVMCTGLGIAERNFPLHNGSLTEPSHWQNPIESGGLCIGVVAPYIIDVTNQCQIDGYLYESDKRALDVIGWNIDLGNEPLPPIRCVLGSPAETTFVRSLTPTFDWQVGSLALWSHLLIMDGPPTGSRPVVFRETFIPNGTSMFTLPSGVLQFGQDYTWTVTAENDAGVAYSDLRLLRVRCPSDFDGNTIVSTQDLFDFISAFSAMNPAADFDGNGAVSTQDLFDFITAWQSGC